MNNNNENPMATQQDNNSTSAYPQQENSSVYMQQSASTSPYVPQENDSAYPQQTGTPSVYPQPENSTPLYAQKESGTAPYTQQNQMYGGNSVPATPLLQLNDLCKRYPGMGSYMSVFHMNLVIPRGRIIGLLGPNGCGKSTLIKMINGLLTPTCGNVLINGLNPCAATKKVISYLPERTYLDNSMKVSQMVGYFADFYEDFSTED